MMKDNFDFNAADRLAFDGELGAAYYPEKTVFRVWQPFAESAAVRIYRSTGDSPVEVIPMKRNTSIFECEKRGDCSGLCYTFVIKRNGEAVETADPYSRAVTADGTRSVIIDMNAHKPDGWERQSTNSAEEPVIYELSVRDFSMDKSAGFKHRGKFSAFCEDGVVNSYGDTVGLDYIKSLGVTHIQLMPIFDFDLDGGEYNWGYNPRFFNAPSCWYAERDPVSELRGLIAAAHRKGLGVVADVVYNHLYSADGSAFGKIFPEYYFRHDKNGAYSNGSGCGNEFASEREMARKFIVDSLVFLAREYKLDGFRFDLMGVLDIKTLRIAERRLREINPNILLYGEGWTGGASALRERRRAVRQNAERLPGFAFFNDSFRDAVKGSVFDAPNCGYVNGAADERRLVPIRAALTGEYTDFWTRDPKQTLNYVECHDNLTLFDKLTASMDGADGSRIAAAGRMAAALTVFSRGIVFIHAGQEFLRTKEGSSNSYDLPDSVNSLKWDKVTENRAEVEYYRGLITLRKRFFGGFTERVFSQPHGGFMIRYGHADGEFILFVNPTREAVTVSENGAFEVYADGERASDKPLYTANALVCGAESILFSRRIPMNKLEKLRGLMSSRGIYAYIVCTDDFHGSEYVGAHFRLREYLSGFTGSAGTLVVLPDTAALWTDGRYFIQAENELHGSGIVLMKSGERGVPTIEEYLGDFLPDGAVIGFDGRAVSALFAEKLLRKLSEKHISARSDEDLGGMVWEERPPLSAEPVYALPKSVCGRSAVEKIENIRKKIADARADCLVISALDEIAWTLNLRGGDVDYNPVFLAFMAIFEDEILLFANRDIFSAAIVSELEKMSVKILPYADVYNSENWLDKRVWLDSGAVNFKLKTVIGGAGKIINAKSSIMLMKSKKNHAEIEAEKAAHLLDGIAVTRFMYWLKQTVGKEKITEISAAEKLEEFRKMGDGYLGQSFAPIMAYGEHGAIVHYSATEESDAELQPRGMLLSDTGGHYLGGTAVGTTDITRTFVLGELTEDERRAFTIVLAGHLELLRAVFPKGTRGSALDGIARRPLWLKGMDFNHGTGHGVGFLLNVHEGPQRIAYKAVNDAPLEEGMITSDEPGYYAEGEFGIRHESLVLCTSADVSGFLRFVPLTLVPFDRDGIVPELLSAEQRGYLNDYHALVYEQLSPHLAPDEKQWLKEITALI